MEFLPRTLGTRPRLACEVRPEGVVAARAEDASAVLSAVARVDLADGVIVPQLRGGAASANQNGTPTIASALASAADRAALVAAIRKALEGVALRAREVTLVVPDAAVRVLLLDFDALPSKSAEALPVVRFRLKKLLPFDADDAAVSYQVMSSSKAGVRVVAVAMPREVLAEYEALVREAGFEPGAILPSTLAALAGLPEGDTPVLLVNAGLQGVTTAIVKAGVLLLHRTVDLGADMAADMAAHLRNEATATEFAAAGASIAVLDPAVATEVAVARTVVSAADEVAQAVSVAAAYFEDTLETAPSRLLATGTMGAEALAAVLEFAGSGPVRVEELVAPEMLGPGTPPPHSPGHIPLGWLAGVRGALAD
jgi:type IV pilus assembly protein PilM